MSKVNSNKLLFLDAKYPLLVQDAGKANTLFWIEKGVARPLHLVYAP